MPKRIAKQMGLFSFLKSRKKIDPVWGHIEPRPLGYSCKVQFAETRHPVRLTFSSGATSPTEQDRSALKSLEDKYHALIPNISAAILDFWKQYKKGHDTPNNYSQSFPTINNASEMQEASALFAIEFGPNLKDLKLFYEFGSHSEYVFAVTLDNFVLKGVSFS